MLMESWVLRMSVSILLQINLLPNHCILGYSSIYHYHVLDLEQSSLCWYVRYMSIFMLPCVWKLCRLLGTMGKQRKSKAQVWHFCQYESLYDPVRTKDRVVWCNEDDGDCFLLNSHRCRWKSIWHDSDGVCYVWSHPPTASRSDSLPQVQNYKPLWFWTQQDRFWCLNVACCILKL